MNNPYAHIQEESKKSIIIRIIAGILAFGIIICSFIIIELTKGLPDIKNIDDIPLAESTKIFDREGNLLYIIHGEEDREQIDYDEISPYLINATIAIEDDNFWDHRGFDIWGTGKAILHEFFGIGTPRGGSTITQQYVKNTFLTPEKTYIRKIKEIVLATRMERAYTKNEILLLYLNRIPFGNNAYGCEKAAEIYFNKNAKDLNLAESVILASLPQAPSTYNPFGNNKYSHLTHKFTREELKNREIENESDLETTEFERGLFGKYENLINGTRIYISGRTDLVLNRMYELEMIDLEQKKQGLKDLRNIVFNDYREEIIHPHFVLYIIQELEKKYDKSVLEQGGLNIYTTLDPELQQFSEELLAQKSTYYDYRFGADNIASLTINSKTGEILSMVGSVDYYNEEIDGNVNVVVRPRQPGSSFKPIVYARAFYEGYSPGNIIYDVPTKIGSRWPQNYDGSWFGELSIRRALGQSRNIPAIKAYYLAGEQQEIIDLSEKMGITTLNPDHSYGYPLALGAGEVPLIEMINAYSVFANNGKKVQIKGILKIIDNKGNTIESLQPNHLKDALDPEIAYMINNILSDQSVGIGPNLYVRGHINAAKTGTSTKESKSKWGSKVVKPGDAWTIGYTPSIVTGVWVGNTDGSGMYYNANGYDTAAPIFKSIMTKALEDMPVEPFPVPEGIKYIVVNKSSGSLATSKTSRQSISTEIISSYSTMPGYDGTYSKYKPIANKLNWASEIKAYYSKFTSKQKKTTAPETEN